MPLPTFTHDAPFWFRKWSFMILSIMGAIQVASINDPDLLDFLGKRYKHLVLLVMTIAAIIATNLKQAAVPPAAAPEPANPIPLA